jgi:phage-related protein
MSRNDRSCHFRLSERIAQTFGYALSLAQMGDQDDAAMVLKGFGGAGVEVARTMPAARTGPSTR